MFSFSQASTPEIVAFVIFVIAVLHTFSATIFAKFAETSKHHAGFWHLLSEVEVVFGFWAFVLIIALIITTDKTYAINYLESRNFTEPLFVFVIMVMAASKPVLETVNAVVRFLAKLIPINRSLSTYFLSLSLIPLLGSFITEPAAMTLAAMLLKDRYYHHNLSTKFMYATLGVLFVNVSIGGTLTHFAAPPVLMVAGKWQWDTVFMFTHFGWKAAIAVLFNATVLTLLFRKEILDRLGNSLLHQIQTKSRVPLLVAAVHLLFLVGVVFFAHHPVVFMGLFLFFLGYTEAYKKHQNRLILREGLMVAFFLAGLVCLGGLQQWWIQPTLKGLEPNALYYLATALTAITDNAALTYLASLVEGISDEFKYAVVSGAVTGGGLTVIANAPNPAGMSLLKSFFPNENVSPLYLFLAAALPTIVAILAFRLL